MNHKKMRFAFHIKEPKIVIIVLVKSFFLLLILFEIVRNDISLFGN